jgi:biopolymer transport protein ExbB
MWPLLACSLVAVTIAIERALFWTRYRRRRDPVRLEQIGRLVSEGRMDEARALSAESADGIVRVIHAGLAHHEISWEAAVRVAAGREIKAMRRWLRVLDTIITLGPLLGILGTVLGIIAAFDVLGGGLMDNPIGVTGGIAQALITTAVGLAVAIVALVPYNYFTARMEEAVGDMEGHLGGLELRLSKGGTSREA